LHSGSVPACPPAFSACRVTDGGVAGVEAAEAAGVAATGLNAAAAGDVVADDVPAAPVLVPQALSAMAATAPAMAAAEMDLTLLFMASPDSSLVSVDLR
jgi:hypothetical protein